MLKPGHGYSIAVVRPYDGLRVRIVKAVTMEARDKYCRPRGRYSNMHTLQISERLIRTCRDEFRQLERWVESQTAVTNLHVIPQMIRRLDRDGIRLEVSRVLEVVVAFCWCEGVEDIADGVADGVLGAPRGLAQPVLEL